jgi:carbon storage regulator CsrA
MKGKLVLARKNDEGITITLPSGEKIHICVNIKSSTQVALAFDAPKDVEINRDEIEQRKRDGVPFSKKEASEEGELKRPKIMHKRPRGASHLSLRK